MCWFSWLIRCNGFHRCVSVLTGAYISGETSNVVKKTEAFEIRMYTALALFDVLFHTLFG